MEKRCYECMEPISDGKVCPKCGFNNETAAEGGRFLKERYYIGNVFSKTLDSTVYIAYDEELNKKVFVREFTGENIAKLSNKYTAAELKQKFLNYAKGTATLNMCNLLPHTMDVFEKDEVGYLVTDYFEGENLKTLLNSGIKISYSNAVKMVKQLLNGLESIHNAGFVFGAISPETLYVLKNGEVRIFGLANRFYDFAEDLDCRAELLNPSYAAPELFEEELKVGAYCDVYSAAAILYRILTNKIPPISFLRSGGENLTSPRKINKNIPKNVAIALLNALNWQIESRTASVKALLNDLSAKKVKRVRSGAIIWANILGFFQKSTDKSEKPKNNKNNKKTLLWLWITIPAIILIALILFLIFFFQNTSDNGDNSADLSTSIEDGWYYGNGTETPVSSNDYVYGGEDNKQSSRPNKNNSGSSSLSSMPNISQNNPNLVESPDLLSYYLDAAKEAIEDADCVVGSITFKESADHYVNQIIAQYPSPYITIKKGTAIDLVLCKLPDVSETNLYQAISTLEKAGVYNIEYKFDASSTKAPGTVIKNYFEDNSNPTRSNKVIVTVSGEKAEVSDYLDKTVAEMKGLTSDFVFEFKMQNGNPLPENADLNSYTVVSQSVEKGMPAYKGMTVTITVVTFND